MPNPTPANPFLVEAIEKKLRLSCVYHGEPRVIEPQCYGIGRRGHELLRVCQVGGGDKPERLFTVADIESPQPIGAFTKAGPNYKRDDSAMAFIFAQL